MLQKTSGLKQARDAYNRKYIKKDVHPSIRDEWRKLRKAEKAEKERPENAECTICLDVRERKLYKDGIVINAFSPQFSQTVKIVSWNINGVKTTLKKNCVQEFLLKNDMVSLNEVKKALSVSFPGYLRSTVRGSNERDGTILLVEKCVSTSYS